MLGWWLPESVSIGGSIFHLLYWSSAAALVVAQVLLARLARPASSRRHGLREIAWAIVPGLLLLSFGIVSHRSPNALAAGRAQIALETAPPAPRCDAGGAAK